MPVTKQACDTFWVLLQEVEEAVQGAEQSRDDNIQQQPGGTPSLKHHELEVKPSSLKTGKTSTRAVKTRRKRDAARAEAESTPEMNTTTRVSTAPQSRRQSARLASTKRSTRLTRSLARVRDLFCMVDTGRHKLTTNLFKFLSVIQTLQVAKQEEQSSDVESDASKDEEDADWSPDMPRKRLRL